jgi:hypothetical protein
MMIAAAVGGGRGAAGRGRGARGGHVVGRGGRGRGRGGRGGGGGQWACAVCDFANHAVLPYCESCGAPQGTPAPVLDGPSRLLGGSGEVDGSFEARFAAAAAGGVESPPGTHAALLREDPRAYIASLAALLAADAQMSAGARARALAGAWAAGARDVFDALIARRGYAGLPELLRAAQMLDARRLTAQLTRRAAAAVAAAGGHGEARPALRAAIARAARDVVPGGSLTRSFAKRVARWAAAIPADALEFYLLNFPVEPWQKLADLCHLSPGDFAVPYFLPCAFGAPPPEGSLVAVARAVTASTLPAALKAEPRLAGCYSFIRRALGAGEGLPEDARVALAAAAPLEDVLWFYEELACSATDTVIAQRLSLATELQALRDRSSFGKLMERLLVFRERGVPFAKLLLPFAESRLAEAAAVGRPAGAGADVKDGAAAAAPAPARRSLSVAVLGDASGSMEVAIRAATILSGLLAASMDADLVFFGRDARRPESGVPRTAAGVLAIADGVAASGVTCPAAALAVFADARTRVDLFVVVSDEGENTPHRGLSFAQAFAAYRDTVYAGARVLFVSFLGADAGKGRMVASLARLGIAATQVKFDPVRPDLTRFDALLGQVRLTAHALDGGSAVAAVPAPPAAAAGDATEADAAAARYAALRAIAGIARGPEEDVAEEGGDGAGGGGAGGGGDVAPPPLPETNEQPAPSAVMVTIA